MVGPRVADSKGESSFDKIMTQLPRHGETSSFLLISISHFNLLFDCRDGQIGSRISLSIGGHRVLSKGSSTIALPSGRAWHS